MATINKAMNLYQSEISRIRNICYPNSRQLETVIALRRFINRNFKEELNLNRLSDTHFTSKFHLLRLFKRYYGMTPKQYLILKRMEESKKCLKQGMSISETCYFVGFETPSSFSTLFRQRTGFSPTEFQKKQFSQSGSGTV